MSTTIHHSTPGLPYHPVVLTAEAEGVDVTIPAPTPRTARFQARQRNGRWQVQLRVEELYDVHQVAAVLALSCTSAPADLKLTTVRRLLQRAATDGLTGPRAVTRAKRKCDPQLVDEFHTALLRLGVFSGDPTVEVAVREKAQRELSVHVRGRRGEVSVRLATTWFDLDQAAAALAIQLPNSAPHFGHKTVQDALHAAAERRLTDAALQDADQALTASYRQTLIDLNIFP